MTRFRSPRICSCRREFQIRKLVRFGRRLITLFEYTPDGDVAKMQVINPATGATPQTTEYQHGTALPASDVSTEHLLSKMIYPDGINGAAGDCVQLDYNRLGQVKRRTDQRGVVHEYLYDELGRLVADKVLGKAPAGTVRQIGYGYDALGMVDTIISQGGNGEELNAVLRCDELAVRTDDVLGAKFGFKNRGDHRR